MITIKNIPSLHILHIAQLKAGINEKPIVNGLEFPTHVREIVKDDAIRILWQSPDKWLCISEQPIEHSLSVEHYAITDLSHARYVIDIEGDEVFKIIKKGCAANINQLAIDQCLHSQYKGVNFTLDYINDNPKQFRLMVMRSFGEFFHHSIEEAMLEFSYNHNDAQLQ